MATAASGHRRAFSVGRQSSLRAPATVDPPNDATLMHAAQHGDRDALIQLVRSLQDVWFRFALATLSDEHLARDAAQETAMRFLQQLSQFRSDSSVRTWSLGIVLNVSRELRRKHAKASQARPVEHASHRPTPPQLLEQADAQARLRRAMASLGDRQREAIVLRYFEHRSIAEIAHVMDCATGTVKATLAQSLKRLRSYWSEDDAL